LVFINPIFDSIFVGKENPWTTHWFNSYLPSLQLQHVCAALGVTRLGLQSGLFHEPFNYEETPDIVRKRQKYLRCKPGHISSLVEESYFLNESLSQTRLLQKIRPLRKDIPIKIIWTEEYGEKISTERKKLWLKSQEMYTSMLSSDSVVTTKLRGSLPKSLFTKHRAIIDIIEKSVKDWRTKSRVTAKY